MWPFRKNPTVNVRALQDLIELQSDALQSLESQVKDEIERLEWRLEMFMRFYEECTGHICDSAWGAPPLVSPGSPMLSSDFQIPSPPAEAPKA